MFFGVDKDAMGIEKRVRADYRAELTSPTPGIVHAIYIAEGEMVKVGMTLCDIKTDEEGGEEGGASEAGEAAQEDVPATTSAAQEEVFAEAADAKAESTSAETAPQGSSRVLPSPNVVVQEEAVEVEESKEEPFDNEEVSTGVQFSGEAAILPSAPPSTHSVADQPFVPRRERDLSQDVAKKVVLSSPAVRTLAAKLGVDLADVPGSGERGRVTRQDVEAYASSKPSRAAPANPTHTAGSAPPAKNNITIGNRDQWEEVTKVPFGRTRKVMWKALGSQGDVPHFG